MSVAPASTSEPYASRSRFPGRHGRPLDIARIGRIVSLDMLKLRIASYRL